MAAGRHGGYYNEFRENEADFDASKREIPYSRDEYERLKNGGSQDYERGRNRARDGKDRGRVRQRDVKERELVTGGGYQSASSRSDSGGSGGDGGLRHREYPVRVRDREPGELSSDSGSDEAVDLEIHGKNDKGSRIEEAARSHSHSPIKKRKFSPIVWDRDDKEVGNISKSRFSTANTTVAMPPVPKSHRQSPDPVPPAVVQISTLEKDKLQTAEQSPGNTPVDIGTHESYGFAHAGLSSSPLQREHVDLSSLPAQEERLVYVQNAGQPEDEDYAPAHNIRSSRWANDVNSPADEGEVSDALGNHRIQKRQKIPSGSDHLGSEKKSLSPEIGELHREGSEGTRTRSSESYENGYHIRASSSDDYSEKELARKDYMEIDEDHSSGRPSVSQSYTDSESEDGSCGTPQTALPPQRSVNMLQGCRSVDEFERLNKIDEGTYGVVYRAKDKKSGEVVALKKVKMEKEREGFPLTSLREINILLSFHHPSVVDVKEVVVGSNLDSIFMVMEYMEHDLKALMETMKQPFSQSEVKCLMLQLLEGTKYLHDNWVLHRDLKTSNLLLNNRGELKICDFGLSRQYGSPLKPYTHLVVTLWYRAPELLLGAKQYSTAIDMWSLGCIMAELLSKQPLFNGKTEFDQLDKIFKTLGTPNEAIWPGFSKLPGVKLNFVKHQYNLLRRKFPATSFTGSPVLSDAGFDLLNKLLTYDPEKRITAEVALEHEWFREVPLPKSKDFMPTFPAHHAQDRRTRRVMKSPDPLEEQRRTELQQAKLGTVLCSTKNDIVEVKAHVAEGIGNICSEVIITHAAFSRHPS
ncbi:cyclin-dependent kinase G-2-like isoform X1 [Cynara cardunculus var. scolymus]|uniref:cyclin-dependent kinase G-2-like isoform X1 n=1 Tax=Cynara cardunculus var. scolymus TaxID=59895 RepID=UPI000D6276C7|nr:cyclin-dependent kinase G-2-like isoform X1 [Cynara cardunculus var. scolymus]